MSQSERERVAVKTSNESGAEGPRPQATPPNGKPNVSDGADSKPNRRRWMPVALGSALVLTLLTVAGIVLVIRPASTVDQLLILTVPSGADVSFDSQPLGHSPVKLEGVRIGMHRLSVSKDGFQTIEKEELVSSAGAIDYKLKPLPPKGTEDLTKDEAIAQYKQKFEEAFERGDFAIPYQNQSALYFAEMILYYDESNPAGLEMKGRVKDAVLQAAQSAASKGDLGQANDLLNVLMEHFPDDDAVRAAAARLERQLANHRGDIRDLIRKAEDALRAGNLVGPQGASAYYYARQALALDRQNPQARAVRNQIRDSLAANVTQSIDRGDYDDASRQLNEDLRLYPDDKQLSGLMRDLDSRRDARRDSEARANEPSTRRNKGLKNYAEGNYQQAISDLEFALEHDTGDVNEKVDVRFALGRSYYKVRQYDKASTILRQIPQSAGKPYVSALGVMGDAAAEEGEATEALDYYNRALTMGGSDLYMADALENKIAKLNKRAQVKSADPTPLSIPVKHLHGGILHGSCSGTLTVDRTGVRYDGPDTYSSSIMGTEVAVKNDEITIKFLGKTEKFKASRRDAAERFREALFKYQAYNP